jgi:hypothetical protein
MAAEPISRLLASPELRPLSERLAEIRRLQRRYRTLAPEALANASRVCAIDGTTVVIGTASGAVAAALRHIAPRLLAGLKETRRSAKQQRDQELTSLRIEVQVEVPTPKRPVRARGEMPRERLAQAAAGMADSPLKETLTRIGRDAQSRSTRSKT